MLPPRLIFFSLAANVGALPGLARRLIFFSLGDQLEIAVGGHSAGRGPREAKGDPPSSCLVLRQISHEDSEGPNLHWMNP